jgi:hypothetical protein
MTPRNRMTIAFLLPAAAVAGAFFLFRSSPEKAVERLLRKGAAAIEAEDMDRLAPLISLGYRDDLGLGYAALRGSFEYVFSQFSGIAIDYRVTSITPGNDTVTANVTVWGRGVWMDETQNIAGSESEPVPLSLLCRKELLKWKVIGSRWPRGTTGLRELF